ncbi:MAG: hypothetical protein ABEJ47_04415 [Halorhabdus sp.]
MATNTTSDETLADQIAMALGGGLPVLGVIVLGLVEVLSGKPYSPKFTKSGAVASGVTVDPTIRAGLIVLGMVVLLGFAIYAVVTQQHLGE